jgi:hypothetical protein
MVWCDRKPHLSWDMGHVTLTPTDWVDQAGDHAHFHTLHADFLIPYTLLPLPQWLMTLVPLGICHDLFTYRGDDAAWVEKREVIGMGSIDKYLIYFTDRAGLTWKKQPMKSTMSETLEMYIGPAMMSFHIPFTIGKTYNTRLLMMMMMMMMMRRCWGLETIRF